MIEIPVAIAVGGKDRSIPFAALESMVDSQLPRGEYWYFENAGHALSTHAAQAFNRSLSQFVKRLANEAAAIRSGREPAGAESSP